MTGHKHAALMLQYAQDAMETEQPWERWEFSAGEGACWLSLSCHPSWSGENEYRRKPEKPRTMIIAGIEVPMPMMAARKGDAVYLPSLALGGSAGLGTYMNNIYFGSALDSGILHLSEQAATVHAQALIKVTRDAMETARKGGGDES